MTSILSALASRRGGDQPPSPSNSRMQNSLQNRKHLGRSGPSHALSAHRVRCPAHVLSGSGEACAAGKGHVAPPRCSTMMQHWSQQASLQLHSTNFEHPLSSLAASALAAARKSIRQVCHRRLQKSLERSDLLLLVGRPTAVLANIAASIVVWGNFVVGPDLWIPPTMIATARHPRTSRNNRSIWIRTRSRNGSNTWFKLRSSGSWRSGKGQSSWFEEPWFRWMLTVPR